MNKTRCRLALTLFLELLDTGWWLRWHKRQQVVLGGTATKQVPARFVYLSAKIRQDDNSLLAMLRFLSTLLAACFPPSLLTCMLLNQAHKCLNVRIRSHKHATSKKFQFPVTLGNLFGNSLAQRGATLCFLASCCRKC